MRPFLALVTNRPSAGRSRGSAWRRGGLCSLLLAAWPALAAESFVIYARPVALPEQGYVTGYIVETDGHQFSFLPVRKWHLQSNAATKEVTFVAPNLSASINLKILSKASDAAPEMQSAALRAWIQERYPKANIVGEFPCFANGGQGLAFDLEENRQKGLSTTTRLAFLPFDDGVVEFKLTAPTTKFLNYKLALGNLLTSFRTDPDHPSFTPPPGGPKP